MKNNLILLLLSLWFFTHSSYSHAAVTESMQVIQLKTDTGWTADAQVSFPKFYKGQRPVVIFAHGGGCKDIDCKVGSVSYPFWMKLDEWFLERGFVVIRFYRGQTKSVQDDIALLRSAYDQAKHLKSINPQKIGFFGHSEGTWQSVIATKEILDTGAPIGFVILNGTFIVNLKKHSQAQLRELFKPVEYFVGRRLSSASRRRLKNYLSSWSIPQELISRLDKDTLTFTDIDEVRSKFLVMIQNYIDKDEKLSSWKKLSPVENVLPFLGSVPVIINQGRVDQETPFQEIERYLSKHKTENIFLNNMANLNHYFVEVKDDHTLPTRSWGPISKTYFRSLDRSLTVIGL